MANSLSQYAQYVVRITLTRFIGARVMDVENEFGDMETCVCIPLNRNNLKRHPNGNVSAYFFMVRQMKSNIYGWTHWLKMKLDPNFIKKINEMGIENPFIGNAKAKSYIAFKDAYDKKLVKESDYE